MADGKMKAVTGVWSAIGVQDLNRILKPHGVRLVKTTKKAWGEAVSITAHRIEAGAKANVPAPFCPPHDWGVTGVGATTCVACGVLRDDFLRG